MSANISVSVIIPVYNAAPYLRQCLDSVVNQTLREIEILCVDDGSTDGSLEILREYEARDSRVRVLMQPHINAGAARNRGLDEARGRYLSFLDADDFFEPEMLERACAQAVSRDAQIVVFRCDLYHSAEDRYEDRSGSIIAGNLPETQPFAGIKVKGNLFHTFLGWAWDKLFSREFVQTNGLRFQEQRTTNDLFFTYFALAKAERISTVEDVFAHHRTRVGTSLEATREKSWDCFYKALLMLRDALKRDGLFVHYERAFVNYSVSFVLWNLFTLSWPAQELVFYLLKHVWLRELGVAGRGEEYFDDRQQYREICEVLDGDYASMFPEGGSVHRYRAEIAALTEENNALKEKITALSAENTSLREAEARSIAELAELRTENSTLQADITSLYESVSFKLGRAATCIPRKIRDGVRDYRKP